MKNFEKELPKMLDILIDALDCRVSFAVQVEIPDPKKRDRGLSALAAALVVKKMLVRGKEEVEAEQGKNDGVVGDTRLLS